MWGWGEASPPNSQSPPQFFGLIQIKLVTFAIIVFWSFQCCSTLLLSKLLEQSGPSILTRIAWSSLFSPNLLHRYVLINFMVLKILSLDGLQQMLTQNKVKQFLYKQYHWFPKGCNKFFDYSLVAGFPNLLQLQ